MREFKIYNNKITYDSEKVREIAIFKTIFDSLLPLVKNKFGNKFLDIKIEKKYDYLDWDHSDYTQKLCDLLIDSCKEIKREIFFILQIFDIYSYDQKEIESDIEIYIQSALEMVHPYYFSSNSTNIIKDTNKFNNYLKNNPLKKELFIYELCVEIALSLRYIILWELYYSSNSKIVRGSIDEIESSFKDKEIYEYVINNNQKKIRENIELSGINNNNLYQYIKTFEKAPFNISRYLFLLENIGDQYLEIENLFTFIFGSNSIIIEYKQVYLDRAINKAYKNVNYKNLKIDDLKNFAKFIENKCTYLGLDKNEYPIYLNIINRLKNIYQ